MSGPHAQLHDSAPAGVDDRMAPAHRRVNSGAGAPMTVADMPSTAELSRPTAAPARRSAPVVLERPRRRIRSEVVADGLTLTLALVLATATAPAGAGVGPFWAAAYGAFVLVGLHLRDFNVPRLGQTPMDGLGRSFAVTATAAMALTAVLVLVDGQAEAARSTLRLWAFTAVYLTAGRLGLAIAIRRLRRAGEGGRRTLIIGAGEVGARMARRLTSRPELGLRPVGFLDKEPRTDDAERVGLPVLGASWDLERVVTEHGVEHVVLAFSTAPHAVMLDLTNRANALGAQVSVVPRLYEQVTHRVTVEHVGGIPLMRADRIDPKSWQFTLKYAMGRLLAGLAVLAVAPLLLGLALAVRLSSPGPVLFRQRRIGVDGHEFDILKFRTMREAPAAVRFVPGEDQAPGGVEGDDRRTTVGTFLRRFSLDELPQLLNVVRGDMAIIGPRPERPEFVAEFERRVYRYGDRHRVRSGLTGWAQVHGLRGQTSLGDRVEWDNYYIENWSLWLDLKILALTIPAVLSGHNAE